MQKKQLQALTLEQKCALLSGGGTFTTRALPKAGIPSITLSDGPNGVRKQAGAADHLEMCIRDRKNTAAAGRGENLWANKR